MDPCCSWNDTRTNYGRARAHSRHELRIRGCPRGDYFIALGMLQVTPHSVRVAKPQAPGVLTHHRQGWCDRYRLCAWMYWTTGAGVSPSIGSPRATRCRIVVALMSICGTSTTCDCSF